MILGGCGIDFKNSIPEMLGRWMSRIVIANTELVEAIQLKYHSNISSGWSLKSLQMDQDRSSTYSDTFALSLLIVWILCYHGYNLNFDQ